MGGAKEICAICLNIHFKMSDATYMGGGGIRPNWNFFPNFFADFFTPPLNFILAPHPALPLKQHNIYFFIITKEAKLGLSCATLSTF